MATSKSQAQYSLKTEATGEFAAPALPYLPPRPQKYNPNIALIGCGGISQTHLSAYRQQGYNVIALCDHRLEVAQSRAAEFYPDAFITTDYREILALEDIEVVDIATHPAERIPLIKDALAAGKHVLSQKPFVLDLDTGAELVALAEACQRKIAVNQNGRWAPHFAYLRAAIEGGTIGEVIGTHCQIHWDHTWVKGTPFEKIHDLILYDFSIHWFDATATFWGNRVAKRVYATKTRVNGQEMSPPMAAQVVIEYEGGQASLIFDAHTKFGPQDHTYIAGTKGSLVSIGPGLGEQEVTLYNADGYAIPSLEGTWFPDGFAGTMGELLCAIEEGREPSHSARNNLKSLELCFAAIASTFDGEAKIPGEVRRLPAGSVPPRTADSR